MPAYRVRFSTLLVGALLVAALPPCAARANPARDELLRFIPDDVAFCLVVNNLRGHWEDLNASPLAQKWRTPLLSAMPAAERKQIADFEKYVAKHLGVTAKDVLDDILGDAVVLAFRPALSGKSGEDEGLVAVHARDAKKLAALIDRVNALQKGTGEIAGLTKKEYRGLTYVARREAKGTSYYLLRGPLFLFTAQEAILKRAVDCHKGLSADGKAPLALRLEEMGLQEALIALVVGPRVWDDVLTGKAVNPASKTFVGYWKALDCVGLGLHLARDVRLSLTAKGKADRLPAAGRRLLATASKPPLLAELFPENALFCLSGRLDLPALYEAVGDFLPPATRKTLDGDLQRSLGAVLGKDVFKDVLPALGPDWGVCLTAPPAEGKQWAPAAWLALRVARGDEDDPIDQAVLSAVKSSLQLLVLGHNKQHPEAPMSLKTTSRDKVRVRYLSGVGLFPPGVEPAFALKAGFLVLASSPDVIARLAPPPAAKARGDALLLRVSFAAWRAYLKDRREALADALSKSNALSKTEALARLDAAGVFLGLLDRAELRQRRHADTVSWTLTLTPSLPLKKAPDADEK